MVGSNGTYEEILACGGALQITKGSWKIRHYFPGPDLRHNGTFVEIPGSDLPKYIDAYEENWKEYQLLRMSIPEEGEFQKVAKQGMALRIGKFHPGVCIIAYHMPINSESALKKLLDGYHYALERAPKIQGLLKGL
jgi:hypothetical protein